MPDLDLEKLAAMLKGRTERRTNKAAEVRATGGEDGAPAKIEGYAAVFNSPSEPIDDGWGFRFVERIMPGAFTKTIKENDIRALWNHNPDYVIGRNVAGTLTLAEDGRGLLYSADPPETQWAQDLVTSMKRGDVSQSSFAFTVVRERWIEDHQEGAKLPLVRDVLEAKLYDVSPVTYPAYPQTSAMVRGLLIEADLDLDEISRALMLASAGQPLSPEYSACLRSAIAVLQAHIPSKPAEVHLQGIARRRRELQLVALA